MTDQKSILTRLLILNPIEPKDEADEKLERCYNFVQSIIGDVSEKDAHDALNQAVCKSSQSHEEVCLGLLMGILTDPPNAPRYYRDLTFVSRDGLLLIVDFFIKNLITKEKLYKFTPESRTQAFFLLGEFIKNNINGLEALIFNFLRLLASGDVSPRNIAFVESTVDLLIANRPWLDTYPTLIASVVYTFLRLIQDHYSIPQHSSLCQKEVDLCVSLLRDKFTECITIGRDLVRLLQAVARIPEFEKIWYELNKNPTSFSPTFTGIGQLMSTRTSRKFFVLRLTFDMETKLTFLMNNVRFGQQKRYQEWFTKQYLSTPESQSLRCDLIRFICGVIHPPNEILSSDILPRWAVIGWLLSTCTSPVSSANCKLALFFDWLYYDPERDNIMNIEPAILLMLHSMRTHLSTTTSLLDFLCRIVHSYCAPLSNQIRQGVTTAFQEILDKRVISSLTPIFENPKIDKELRILVRETFPQFCSAPRSSSPPEITVINSEPNSNSNVTDCYQMNLNDTSNSNNSDYSLANSHSHSNSSSSTANHLIQNSKSSTEPLMSDDEDEDEGINSNGISAPKKSKLSSSSSQPSTTYSTSSNPIVHTDSKATPIKHPKSNNDVSNSNPISKQALTDLVQPFNEGVRKNILALYDERDNELRCEIMDKLIKSILEDDDFDQEVTPTLAKCLVHVLSDDLSKRIFPLSSSPHSESVIDEDAFEESIGTPIFVMMRYMAESPEEDQNRDILMNIFTEMYSLRSSLGFLLLYFLKVTKPNDSKRQSYREFVREMDNELSASLIKDLKLALEHDINMFCYLLPDIFSNFSTIASGNIELLHMIVAHIDSSQLQDLVCHVVQGNFRMFKRDSLISVLNASLEWETFEQFCLWQLLSAHNFNVDAYLPILPKLEYHSHSEALTNLLLMLQRVDPTQNILKNVLNRDPKPTDNFVVSLLKQWEADDEKLLAELISNHLNLKASPAKRKRNANPKVSQLPGQVSPGVELILSHLDSFRQSIKQSSSFFNQDCLKNALLQVQGYCSDSQKTRFSDLFALVEDFDSKSSKQKNKTSGSGSASNTSKSSATVNKSSSSKSSSNKNNTNGSDTESESDEEIIPSSKSKNSGATQRKKRIKRVVDSDSD